MATTGKAIPEKGVDKNVLLEQMRDLRGTDVDWKQHKAFSLVYHHSDEHTDFMREAYGLFISANGLNPMAFRSLKTMEHDVVRMTANLFHGNDGPGQCWWG